MRRSGILVCIPVIAAGCTSMPDPSPSNLTPTQARASASASGSDLVPLEIVELERYELTAPDWLAATDTQVFVRQDTQEVLPLSPADGTPGDPIDVSGGYCQGLGATSTSVYACRAGTLVRIEPTTGRIEAKSIPILGEEGSFGFGAGSVWALADEGDGTQLLALDPDDLSVANTFALPFPGSQVVFGFDAVWVSSPDAGIVMQFDPTSERVARVRNLPRAAAITTGFGSVWIGTDDGLAAIDPSTLRRTLRVRDASPGDVGGLSVAFGAVWVRSSTEFLQAVDPEDGSILARVDGSSVGGGGSVLGAFDHLWVTAADSNLLFVMDPDAILATS